MPETTTVVVTGGASGVGAATVKTLQRAGVHVVPVDVQPVLGGVELDLGDPASIDAAVAALPDRIDSVVNVAAIPGPEPAVKVMAVNFLGPRRFSEALLDRITDGGSIVTVSSQAGRAWQRRAEVVNGLLNTTTFEDGVRWCEDNHPRWDKDPYTFSKQCVSAWTLRLAGLGRARGIRANCVSPGPIDSALSANFREQIGTDKFDWGIEQVGRMASPAEIADVIEFLAIGRCGWINGAEIVVDGGMEAGLTAGWIDPRTAPAKTTA